MKAGWIKTTLGEAFTTSTGSTPPKSNADFYGQFMPLVKPPELCDSTLDSAEDGLSESGAQVARTLPPNSILVSCIGNLGKIGMNTVPVAFNQQINAIHPDSKMALPEFMFFQTLGGRIREQLEAMASGTTVPIVNKSKFNSIEIVLPPLPEQQRIVTLLDEAFDGIATATAHAEKNLQNARAIFESHLQSIFTQQGDGWISTTIGNSCILKSGTTIPVNIEKSSGDVPYVKVAEMTLPDNQDGITTSIRFLNRADVKAGWLIPAGAVIFPKRGGAILTNKKRLALVDMCADLNIMSVIPTAKLTPEFLYFYFLTVDMRKLGTGSSIPQINNYDIAPLEIAFPDSTRKQAEIADSIRSLESECQALESVYQRKLAALDDLKKSLLHQAFSGEL